MITLQYELVKTELRGKIVLRDFSTEIASAVKKVLGEQVIVRVFDDYYEYEVTYEPTPPELREIGRKISRAAPDLRAAKRAYDYKPDSDGKPQSHTNQIFLRKK